MHAEPLATFFAVDVLQLIGVTFFGVQLLVMLVRSRRAFTSPRSSWRSCRRR